MPNLSLAFRGMTPTKARENAEHDLHRKVKLIDYARLKPHVFIFIGESYTELTGVEASGSKRTKHYEQRIDIYNKGRRMSSSILRSWFE